MEKRILCSARDTQIKAIGLDTLAFSVRGNRSAMYEALIRSSRDAWPNRRRVHILQGIPFRIRSNTYNKNSNYRLSLVCSLLLPDGREILRIDLDPKYPYLPDVYVHVRSCTLHQLGALASLKWAYTVVEELFDVGPAPPIFTLSRVDLYVDLYCPLGFCLDRGSIVTRARKVESFENKGSPCPGYGIGSRCSRIYARLYAKDDPTTAQVRLSSILRIEFELHRSYFRELKIHDLRALLAQAPQIWADLTSRYLRLEDSSGCQGASLLWQEAQRAASQFRTYYHREAHRSVFQLESSSPSPVYTSGEAEAIKALLEAGEPVERPQKRQWALWLRTLGYNNKAIAFFVGCCDRTVRNWIQASGRRRGRPVAQPECLKILNTLLKEDLKKRKPLSTLLPLLKEHNCSYPTSTFYRHVRAMLP